MKRSNKLRICYHVLRSADGIVEAKLGHLYICAQWEALRTWFRIRKTIRDREPGCILARFWREEAYKAWRAVPMKVIAIKVAATRRARLDDLVAEMHAKYMAGASLHGLGKEYARNRSCIAELFSRRGLHVRPSRVADLPRGINGRILPYVPKTTAEIAELIAGMKRIHVPAPLKLEWRKWTLARRGEFIAQARACLQPLDQRPAGELPAGMKFFDYATPEAHEIAKKANTGRNSRTKRVNIKPCSHGIIWNGVLWFWAGSKTGYVRMGGRSPVDGRPVLHHVIWQHLHKRPVPASHVIRFRDGNTNNFTAENLLLETRNALARENQSAALTRKSRALTQLMLVRAQQPETCHVERNADTLTQIHRRSA